MVVVYQVCLWGFSCFYPFLLISVAQIPKELTTGRQITNVSSLRALSSILFYESTLFNPSPMQQTEHIILVSFTLSVMLVHPRIKSIYVSRMVESRVRHG